MEACSLLRRIHVTRCVHAKAAAFAHCKKVDQNHGQIEPVCAIACISNHRISRPSTAVQRVCIYVACELLYMCELSVHSSSERACTSVASCLERHALRRNNVNCHASNQYCKQLLLFGRFAGVWESCAKCYSSKLASVSATREGLRREEGGSETWRRERRRPCTRTKVFRE